MSSAGQANEAGSVARRNAATYFGVHLLAGMPIEALENYEPVTHVGFESADPTDDIILTFAGGTCAFVSSKRKVTYGSPFTDTVKGWIAQIDERPGDEDLLVLVCEAMLLSGFETWQMHSQGCAPVSRWTARGTSLRSVD